jgi:undecaprenyl diphosphate synthase
LRKIEQILFAQGRIFRIGKLNANDMNAEAEKKYIPEHIAVIMDGNGRWAKKKGFERIFGHKNAIKAVREAIEGCAERGVKFLTLYAFSTENWNRPQAEVNALMQLLINSLKKETPSLNKNNIKLAVIGNTDDLPDSCQRELSEAMELTAKNTGLTVILALSYSGRWEIIEAVKALAKDVKNENLMPDDITDAVFARYLAAFPDPDMIIRTSGEMRISNFFLWQAAYTELVFLPVLWPDFRKQHLDEAIEIFQNRERRYGKTGEQLKS